MSTLFGKGAAQVSVNADLGGLAFQEPESVIVRPQKNVTPHEPGDMVFELVSNTSLLVKVKGTDGIVRSATLTLA